MGRKDKTMLSTQHNNNYVQMRDSNKKKRGRSAAKRQLNVWVTKEAKAALAHQARLERRSMTTIVEELIQHYTARQQAELVERQSLPLYREVVVDEVRKALAQQRLELGEDMQKLILEAIKLSIRQSVEQLARLAGRAVRIGAINRRLTRALMARAYGEEFAAQADEDALAIMSKDVPPRSPTKGE